MEPIEFLRARVDEDIDTHDMGDSYEWTSKAAVIDLYEHLESAKDAWVDIHTVAAFSTIQTVVKMLCYAYRTHPDYDPEWAVS